MFYILRGIKNIFIHVRSSLKFVFLIAIAAIIVTSIISLFYKITYSVTLDGEFVGYTNNKVELQKTINEYMEASEDANTAFIEISKLPQYSLCLVKKGNETNDEGII